LQIERDGENYNIKTHDEEILFSFVYDNKFASFPIRIMVPNYNLDNPIMINIEYDDNLNISSYKISDGIFYEDLVDIYKEDNVCAIHRMRMKNKQIIYIVKDDGNIDIIEKLEIEKIDQF
jgi:hypothetical protein